MTPCRKTIAARQRIAVPLMLLLLPGNVATGKVADAMPTNNGMGA